MAVNSDSIKTTGLLPTTLLVAGSTAVFVGERVLGTGSGRTLVSWGGGAVVALALVIRLSAVLRSRGDMRVAERKLLWASGGVALALGLYGASVPLVQRALGLSEDSRLPVLLTVAWLALLTVSGICLLFLERVYARVPFSRAVELRRLRLVAVAGSTLGLAIVSTFAVNYVASQRDFRKDVTYFKTTEPSAGTLSMVGKLDVPMRVLLFYRSADDVLGQLRPYFDKLASASKHLQVQVVDTAMEPELAKKHRVRDNGTIVILVEEDEEPKKEKSEDARTEAADSSKEGVEAEKDEAEADTEPPPVARKVARPQILKIGSELTQARRKLKRLDQDFQQSFTKLTLPSRVLHLTVGHGERNARTAEHEAGDRIDGAETLLKRLNIKTRNLGPAEGLASRVPEDTAAVAIVGPTEDFLQEEVDSLLRYVRGGGRLLLFLDPDVDAGLAPLLAGLGLRQLPGVIASDKKHMRTRERGQGKADRGIIYSNIFSAHPAVTTLSRLQREVVSIFVEGSAWGRASTSGLPSKPKVTFPVRTGVGFWRDRDGDFERGEAEREEPLNMVAAVTLAPEKSADGDKKPGTDADQGRVLVVGDGDFISDKIVRNAGNHLLFIDALAWMMGEDKISGEVASEEDVPIEHTRDEDKIWFYATTFAVPVPILLFGVWIAARRRGRSEAVA